MQLCVKKVQLCTTSSSMQPTTTTHNNNNNCGGIVDAVHVATLPLSLAAEDETKEAPNNNNNQNNTKLLFSVGPYGITEALPYHHESCNNNGRALFRAIGIDLPSQMPPLVDHQQQNRMNIARTTTTTTTRGHYLLKMLLGSATTRPAMRGRLIHEFAVLKELEEQHVNGVVRPVELISTPERGLVLVLQQDQDWYQHGHTLRQLLLAKTKQEGRVGLKQFFMIAKGIVAVLQRLHERGYVHKDIKPDSIEVLFVSSKEEEAEEVKVQLLDFGICERQKYQHHQPSAHVAETNNTSSLEGRRGRRAGEFRGGTEEKEGRGDMGIHVSRADRTYQAASWPSHRFLLPWYTKKHSSFFSLSLACRPDGMGTTACISLTWLLSNRGDFVWAGDWWMSAIQSSSGGSVGTCIPPLGREASPSQSDWHHHSRRGMPLTYKPFSLCSLSLFQCSASSFLNNGNAQMESKCCCVLWKQVVLVRGVSGIGKSSIMQQLHQLVLTHRQIAYSFLCPQCLVVKNFIY